MVAASGLSYHAIRKYAERIGDVHGAYDDDGSIDIRKLVDLLGGRVLVGNSEESLHVDEEDRFTIFVPSSTSMRRDRFTIAHELGHYFLHYLYPQQRGAASFARGGRNRAETEANVFASSLLMPANAFRRMHGVLDGDVRALAAHFDVSPAAANVRCEVLGLPGW